MHDTMCSNGPRISNRVIAEFAKLFFTKEFASRDDESKDLSKAFSLSHMSTTNTISILALRRGFDKHQVELARICACVHDFYTVKTGSTKDHALRSAELAEKFLKKFKELSAEEADLIVLAAKSHSEKEKDSGNWLVELMKDADVLDSYLHCKELIEKGNVRYERLEKIMAELGIKRFEID
ncbi:MAG: HD domain-containing protein [archaeon]